MLHKTPLQEDIKRSRGIAPRILHLGIKSSGVGGEHLHVPVCLPPWEESMVFSVQDAGWAPRLVCKCGKAKNTLTLSGMET
jgi:hypothetical protein